MGFLVLLESLTPVERATLSPTPMGGIAPASRRPVLGEKKVANLLLGAARIGRKLGVVGMREVEIDGEPGCVFEDGDGHAIAVVALNIADDQVQTIHAVANPEKLHHLGRSKH
jgi:RNA polymerase sigma-70 factor (ECF subfamily)